MLDTVRFSQRLLTMFHLPNYIVEFPKIIFFGSIRFFRIARIFAEVTDPKVTEDVLSVELVGFPNIGFSSTMFDWPN